MAYFRGGDIEAVDYNSIISAATGFNRVWSVGFNKIGYGQSILNNVTSPNFINASNWANLYDDIIQLAQHQKTPIPLGFNRPAPDQLVAYSSIFGLPAIPGSLINSLATNTGNQSNPGGVPTTETVVYPTAYNNEAKFNFTVDFASGDQARYFFNAGGLICLKFQHPANTTGTLNSNLTRVASESGILVLNLTNTATKFNVFTSSIIGNSDLKQYDFLGTTMINGDGPATYIRRGYYELTTSYVEIFKKLSGGLVTNTYRNSYISVQAKTNGPQGSNGDNGDTVEFLVTFKIVPFSSTVFASAGTSVQLFVQYPSTAFISNSWGPAIVTGTAI